MDFEGKNIRKSLQIPTGYICNNNCIFCMEPRETRYIYVKSITKKDVFPLLDKYKNKFTTVVFANGEPTLNPNLLEYAKYASKNGYKTIEISTNGRRLFYSDYCLKLIKSGINSFSFSVHGHNNKLHNSLTRTPHSFEESMRGLSNIIRLKKMFNFKIKITLTTVLSKLNYRFLDKIIEFFLSFETDELVLKVMQPVGPKLERFLNSLMPQYSHVYQYIRQVIQKRQELFYLSNEKLIARKIHFTGMPLCISRGNFSCFFSVGEFSYYPRVGQMSEYNGRGFGVDSQKNQDCIKHCKYSDICEGVPRNYIKLFGWGEFKPIHK